MEDYNKYLQEQVLDIQYSNYEHSDYNKNRELIFKETLEFFGMTQSDFNMSTEEFTMKLESSVKSMIRNTKIDSILK